MKTLSINPHARFGPSYKSLLVVLLVSVFASSAFAYETYDVEIEEPTFSQALLAGGANQFMTLCPSTARAALGIVGLVSALLPAPAKPTANVGANAKPTLDVSKCSFYREGVASCYGPGLEGGKTASGSRFLPWNLTAAHRTLPMPSNIIVVNKKTNVAKKVIVNDRGPHVASRTIDLSQGAYAALGGGRSCDGTMEVKIYRCPSGS